MKIFCICGHDKKTHIDGHHCKECNCSKFRKNWNRKKLSVNELLRLACIFAEDNRTEFLDAIKNYDEKLASETSDFILQLRDYRIKRWGKSNLEKFDEKGTSINVLKKRCS